MSNVTNLVQYFKNGAIQTFSSAIAPLTSFSYVVEQKQCGLGDIVRVPFVQSNTSSYDFSYSTGYQVATQTPVAGKNVTLSNLKYQIFDLSDTDILRLNPNVLEKMGASAGMRLAADVISASFSSVMASYTLTSSYTAGQFTSSVALASLDKQANDLNWQSNNRSLIVNTSIKQNLLANADLKNAYAFGSAIQPTAQFQSVYGFTPYTVTCGIGGVQGFAATPNAILFAQAAHRPQDNNNVVNYQLLNIESSGLLVGLREYYEPQYARSIRILECLFGASVGDPTALIKIS